MSFVCVTCTDKPMSSVLLETALCADHGQPLCWAPCHWDRSPQRCGNKSERGSFELGAGLSLKPQVGAGGDVGVKTNWHRRAGPGVHLGHMWGVLVPLGQVGASTQVALGAGVTCPHPIRSRTSVGYQGCRIPLKASFKLSSHWGNPGFPPTCLDTGVGGVQRPGFPPIWRQVLALPSGTSCTH